MKKIITVLLACLLLCSLTGCQSWFSNFDSLKGSITGNTYDCEFYSNSGEKFMTLSGKNIDIKSNIVKERTFDSDGGWSYTDTLSSVVSIVIDGHEVESCGSTILFMEDGLKPDVDFNLEAIEEINSTSNSIFDYTFFANIVNKYKNSFGKPVVVVIQSQLGDPICAFSGDKVYWEVCENLPKTTKLMIDKHALYIHRANFQIIDKALLKD